MCLAYIVFAHTNTHTSHASGTWTGACMCIIAATSVEIANLAWPYCAHKTEIMFANALSRLYAEHCIYIVSVRDTNTIKSIDLQ